MSILIFSFLGLALISGIEVAKRSFSLSTDITRRLAHIGAACIGVLTPLFVSREAIIVVNLLFAAFIFLCRRHKYFSSIHQVKRRTYGDIFLPLGIALAALLFLPNNMVIFQYGVAVMGLADAVAGLVGERYGRHKLTLFRVTKSVEGSAAFLLVSMILTFVFFPHIGIGLICIPLLLTAVECGLIYGLDNLALPTVAGCAVLLFV